MGASAATLIGADAAIRPSRFLRAKRDLGLVACQLVVVPGPTGAFLACLDHPVAIWANVFRRCIRRREGE
jgi:hypothetical protein